MRRALAAMLVLAVAGPAGAQSGGFKIRLEPEEVPAAAPARPSAPGGKRVASPPPEPAEESAPAPPAAAPRATPRRPRKARDWKPLEGTGGEGRRTKWGVVEVVTPFTAAERRFEIRGDELEFPERVLFHHDSIRFTPESEGVLDRIGDMLQATPEVRVLWIEGHTDQTGSARYNQKLSEARASAIREALVRRGLAPERLLAYGFGKTRPAVSPAGGRKQPQNRRVVFRLVEGDRPALQSRSALEWGEAAVVGVWGDARWAPAGTPPESDETAAAPPEPEGAWQPLEFRDQLGEGVDIRTGAGARALLRFPDLSRVHLSAETHIHLGKVFYSADNGKAYIAVQLRQGRISVMANPVERGVASSLYSFAGGSLEVVHADFDLQADAEGAGRLAVTRGSVRASTGAAQSFDVAAGQGLVLAPGQSPAPGPLLPRPEPVAPLTGTVQAGTALTWEPVEGAARYLVQLAEDVGIDQVVQAEQVDGTSWTPPPLDRERPVFWRVVAIAADGAEGMPSKIHAFRTAPGALP